MRSAKILSTLPILAAFTLILWVSGCKTNECKDAVCAPCPSSRFVMEYQDSLGNCLPGFHASARVYAISAENPADTAYSYSFSDSCQAGFLIDEEMVYHVVASNPATNDVISVVGYDYQDPIFVTDCCLCYPVKTVDLLVNGDSVTVTLPTGMYESTPYVRELN